MKVCIIYHSETGNTRSVAILLADRLQADLIEVQDTESYSRLTRFVTLCKRARNRDRARIEPETINVSPYTHIVIGSPVWAFNPTPVVNATIAALQGCEGKKGVVFTTHAGMPGESLDRMAEMLKERGVEVVGAVGFAASELNSEEKLQELIHYLQD